MIIRKRREDDFKSEVNLGLEGGVEASEGIFRGCAVGTLLLDIVLFILLANFIDAEENVDHAHLSVVEFSGDGEFLKENRERKGRDASSSSPFLSLIVSLSLHTTRHRKTEGSPSKAHQKRKTWKETLQSPFKSYGAFSKIEVY